MYLQCLTLTSTLLGRYIAIKPDYLAKWILCYSESQNKISCEIFNIRFQGVLVWNDISDGIKLLPLKSFKKNHKLILSLVPMVIWGSLYSSQFFVNLFLLIIIAYCWVQVKLLLLFLLALGFLLWLVIKEVHLVLAFDIIFPEKSTGMPDSCPKILSIKDAGLSHWYNLPPIYSRVVQSRLITLLLCKPFSAPTAAPIDVRGRNLSSTSILVEWGDVPERERNGIILSYTVTYEVPPDVPIRRQVVNASARQATLIGLNKFTEYKIAVFANTSKGGGTGSEPVPVKTDEDSK